jgi:hypothetical protein
MLISLKANKQSCGPPAASKMRAHLVIVKALKGLKNPCGAASLCSSSKMRSHLVMVIILKANNQSCGPPAASKMRAHLVEPARVLTLSHRIQKRPLKKGPFFVLLMIAGGDVYKGIDS